MNRRGRHPLFIGNTVAFPPAPPTLLSSERQIGSSGDRWVDLYFQGVPERGLILFGISRDPALGSPSEPTSVEDFRCPTYERNASTSAIR